MLTSVLVLAAVSVSEFLNPTNGLYSIKAGLENSPGLTCRSIGVVSVYEHPTLSAKVLGRTQNFIAVTGGEVNGFAPIVTGRKIRGWVQSAETTIGKQNDLRGPCVVQMQPDGRLLFSWL